MLRWREVLSRLIRYGRRAAPFLISGGLVTWLIWHVTPAKLLAALSTGVWPWLVLLTAIQLILTFLWDATCVWWLFRQPDCPLSYRRTVRTRGEATLWSAINLEIGNGIFAWKMSCLQNISLFDTLGRLLLLSLFDFGALQSLALFGSFLNPHALILWLRWFSLVAVCGLLFLATVYNLLPPRWRDWLSSWKLGGWLRWWTWRHSLTLWAMRLTMFLIVVAYAGICLAICGVPVTPAKVLGVVPYVLVAESMPGTGGLGEREMALLYLLQPPGPLKGMVLSFGLIWSVMTILGRLVIGMISTWWPQKETQPEATPSQSAAA